MSSSSVLVSHALGVFIALPVQPRGIDDIASNISAEHTYLVLLVRTLASKQAIGGM